MNAPVPNPAAGDLVKTSAGAILASVVRTITPWLVGLIVTTFTKLHVDVDTGTVEVLVNGLISIAVAGVYYVLVRLLEVFQNSKFGWLLLFARAPKYDAAPGKHAA